MITVARKLMPIAWAISCRRFFSIMMLGSAVELIISEVMSKIIAVTASQRLMSDKVNGKFIGDPLLFEAKRPVFSQFVLCFLFGL